MEDKKLTVEILKAIPFEHNDEPLPQANFIYKTIGLNDLVIEEQKNGTILNITTGNRDVFLILVFLGILLLMLIIIIIFGIMTYNELLYIKSRIPKTF
jgi:hypothetical protein